MNQEQGSDDDTKCDFSFKLVLAGDSGVGKSTLLKRLTEQNAQTQLETAETVGVDFKTMIFNLDRSHIKVGLSFFDTSGAERFRDITRSYFYNVQAFLIAYDINKPNSFLSCKQWLNEIEEAYSKVSRSNSADLIKILVGCKRDMTSEMSQKQPPVPTKKAKKFAKQNGFVLFYETSAKNKLNLKELCEEICLELIANYLEFLNYQQSLIDFFYRPFTFNSFMLPASVYALSTKSDVCFNCKSESLNCNHIILNNLNSKRKNLQTESYNLFDFSFFD